MTVLVTGAAGGQQGKTGRRVTELLRARDIPVRAMVRTDDDRASLEGALVAVGSGLLHETTQDTVVAAFRLAIAEAVHAPEVAAALDQYGRRAGRAAVTAITTSARDHGLLAGDPAEMAERFSALLWGDLMTSLLLRVADPPDPEEIARRATGATAALVRLYAD